jgi:hypothetical protein
MRDSDAIPGIAAEARWPRPSVKQSAAVEQLQVRVLASDLSTRFGGRLTTLKEHNNECQEDCGAIRDRGRVGL